MYKGKKISVSALGNGLIEMHLDAEKRSVNVIDRDTVLELEASLNVIDETSDIKGILVTSGKSVFIAGADITEFEDILCLPQNEINDSFDPIKTIFNRIEALPFPTVVAVNGAALGGGLEFCLACDYRVLSNTAKVGLPETNLGIIPGWGGTVRLPRVIGLQAGAEWIASAAYHSATAAMELGLAADVVEPEQLREVALAVLHEAIADSNNTKAIRAIKTSPMSIREEDALMIAESVKNKVCARTPQLLAPVRAIDLIAKSCRISAEEALKLEGDVCSAQAKDPQARALVGNFMNDQYIKKVAKTYAKDASLSLDKASVVGAGIMGGGIAYQNALKNINVVMKDIAEPALDLGMNEASKLLSKKVRQGRMTEEKKAEVLRKITPTLEASDMDDSKVIVEAVVENLKVKEMVLAELEGNLAEGGILVSNTSTISINRMAKVLKKPEQFAGLHFFNPVHAMKLVEVIRGEKTSDQTIADLVAYSVALGKQPIVVNDCPAFLVNRVLFPYFRGFEQLLTEGADFQRVDQVMESWGWPMGPAYLSDVVGIDTTCHCLDVLAEDFPDRMSSVNNSVIKKLGGMERFGQKNGKGFYQYQMDEKGRPQRSIDEVVTGLVAELQLSANEFTDEEIEVRCMLPMAIEMARCLEEGVVASPAEADMALLMGLGFPAFRGGIVRWMDEMGLAKLCEWGDRYVDSLGEGYRPTQGMLKMAAEGATYY